MPLQHKVSATLAVLIASFVVAAWLILDSVIAPAFDDLEVAAAEADMNRAQGALTRDLEILQATTADWAPWDDMHDYVSGRNPDFPRSNLTRSTLENLGLNVMAIMSDEGKLIWGMALHDGQAVPIDSLEILDSLNPQSQGLVVHERPDDSTVGLVNTVYGGMLVSSAPILRTNETGNIAGAVIMGQLMNDNRLSRLKERTEVEIEWAFNGHEAENPDEVLYKYSEQYITLCAVLPEIHGKPFLVLQTNTPRSITALGSQTITAALTFLIIAGVLVSAFIFFMVHFTILKPIQSLKTHIDEMRRSGDLSRQLRMQKRDEIGELAKQFDVMTADLDDARHALLDQSFKAGKADTAAEVLHNIRNAMTPMINGLDRLRKAFRVTENLRVLDATKAVADPDCPPEKQRKFLQYINASFEHLAKTGADAADDLHLVSAQARQVEGIIAEQEKFAKAAPVSEVLPIDDLLDEATNVIPRETGGSLDVHFEKDIEDVRVKAHRIGLLQVLGNLVLNAYESIKRAGIARGEILLEASDEIVDDVAMVRVTVRDNGAGFDDETGRKIFMRGFTSKSDGDETGLGLHWCANAVAGMGGRIVAASDGQGCGAEFHVLLPAAPGG